MYGQQLQLYAPGARYQTAGLGQISSGTTEKIRAVIWADRTTFEKGCIVVGALSLLGLVSYALGGLSAAAASPRPYRANLRGPLPRPAPRVRKAPGKIVVLASGARFGHRSAPKRYRKAGAVRPSDYAWPQGYKYPLVFRTPDGQVKPGPTRRHIAAAARYFSRSKRLYPASVRRVIARNINIAKSRYGVGGERVAP